MKTFILFTISILLTQCKVKAQGLDVYYLNNGGEKIILAKESAYDVENKPSKFYLKDSDFVDSNVYVIEIYHLIKSKNGTSEHFFKSYSLSSSELSEGFDLNGIFTWITSPFVVSTGFTIRICKTDRDSYLKLKSREDCIAKTKFTVFTGE